MDLEKLKEKAGIVSTEGQFSEKDVGEHHVIKPSSISLSVDNELSNRDVVGEVVEGMFEEYSSLSQKRVENTVEFVASKFKKQNKYQKEIYDCASLMIEKDITKSEVNLLETVLDNELDSATRKGVSIIMTANDAEIRGEETTKMLNSEEITVLSYAFGEVQTPEFYGNSRISWKGGRQVGKSYTVNNSQEGGQWRTAVDFNMDDITIDAEKIIEDLENAKK